MPTDYKIVKEKREKLRASECSEATCVNCGKVKPIEEFAYIIKTNMRKDICKSCTRLTGTITKILQAIDGKDYIRYKIVGDYIHINEKRFLKNFVHKYFGLPEDICEKDVVSHWRSLLILLMK